MVSSTKTILFVSHASDLYGSERSLLDLLSRCPEDIKAVALIPSKGQLADKLEKMGIDYITIPYSLWISPPKYTPVSIPYHVAKNILGYTMAKSRFDTLEIDGVYTNTISCPMGGLLANQLDVPNIWHIREFVEEDHNRWFDFGKRISTAFVERNSQTIIYNSSALGQKYSKFFTGSDEHIIHNGPISTDQFQETDIRNSGFNNPIQILVVGSIHSGKNQLEAIELFDHLSDTDLEIEITIVGDGDDSYIDRCKARATELAVSDRVHWEGYQNNVADYYRNTDITLVPSKCEAFGRVVVEAMSYGSPVIARRAGGIPEIISHGETGFLYSTISESVSYMENLDNNDKIVGNISKRAWESALANFTKDQYASNVYSVIQQEIRN